MSKGMRLMHRNGLSVSQGITAIHAKIHAKVGYSYVSCHQGQSFLTVVSDRLHVTVSCHARKRSGERKPLDHIKLQRPVWLYTTIEGRDQVTIIFCCQQLLKNSAPGDSLRSYTPTRANITALSFLVNYLYI